MPLPLRSTPTAFPKSVSPNESRAFLRELAQRLNIAGRSKMDKAQLFEAVSAELDLREKEVAAAKAHRPKMTAEQRATNYLKQNGHHATPLNVLQAVISGRRLTPKQHRRLAHNVLAKVRTA